MVALPLVSVWGSDALPLSEMRYRLAILCGQKVQARVFGQDKAGYLFEGRFCFRAGLDFYSALTL